MRFHLYILYKNRDYKEAKEFVKNHNIKSRKEWGEFKLNNILPENIPKNPSGVLTNGQ